MTPPPTTLCTVCDARPPAPGRPICAPCTHTAHRDARHIAAHAADLDDHRARRRAVDYRGTRPGGTTAPLPYDPRVTPVADRATRAVGVINAYAATITGRTPPPGLDLTRTALWCDTHLDAILDHPDAPDLLTDLNRARRDLEALVDVPPDTAYLGACYTPTTTPDGHETECTAGLYVEATPDGRPTSTYARCPRCGAQHDVTERRAWLLDHVAEHLATMPELARIMAGLVSRRTLETHVKRGTLTPRGTTRVTDTTGRTYTRPLYRVGDVPTPTERR